MKKNILWLLFLLTANFANAQFIGAGRRGGTGSGGGGGGSETDPTVPTAVKAITTTNIANWNANYAASGTYATLTGTQTLTNKTISGANNTITNIPQASVTNLVSDLAGKQAAIDTSTLAFRNRAATVSSLYNFTVRPTIVGESVLTNINSVTVTNKSFNGGNNTFTNIPQAAINGLSSSFLAKQDALISGTNLKTINGTTLLGAGDITIAGAGGDVTVSGTQTLTNKTISGSSNTLSNIAQSSVTGLTSSLTAKQDALVSGTSIKTINGTTLLGSGDIVISAGGGDATLGTVQTFTAAKTFSANTTLSTLSTSGLATLASSSVTGNETVGGTLGVTGLTTLSTLNATGATTFGSTVGITGNLTNSGSVTLRAGTATAGTSPLKYVSGALLTTAEVGANEFLTDKYYGTITTGAARKEFTMNDATLTSGRVPYATTNGRLLDNANYLFSTTRGGLLSVGTTSATANLNVGATVTATGNFPLAVFTGAAHTAQTASTELSDIYFNLGRVVQFATGNIPLQRTVRISAPTYGFVGASSIAKASTVSISGAPGAGTNATITAAYAFEVESGNTLLAGNLGIGTIPALGTAATTYLTSNSGVVSSRTAAQVASDIGALTTTGTATLTNKTIDFAAGVNTVSNIPVSSIRTADLQVFDPTIYALKTRVGTTASSATPTIDISLYDQYNITALAANAVFAAPTGTAADGQSLLIRVKDNATARTLGWNAAFRAGTDIALPTTTVSSKTMYVQFVYNAADTKWDLTGITNGF